MTTLIKCKDCAYMGDKEDMATGYCLGCYMLLKGRERVKKIKKEAEARQYAIDWQNWASEQSLSYRELFEWGDILTKLAERFDLVEEFHENGII